MNIGLHKYYSRKRENGKLWFDYVHMDEPSSEWKAKRLYPCFLKAPFLESSSEVCCVKNKAEMEAAVANLNKLVAPFFTGYCKFFKRYLDLEKFPLAVENIVVVEELVELSDFIGWLDYNGSFTPFTSGFCSVSPGKEKNNLTGPILWSSSSLYFPTVCIHGKDGPAFWSHAIPNFSVQ